jgi:hypothetical protein
LAGGRTAAPSALSALKGEPPKDLRPVGGALPTPRNVEKAPPRALQHPPPAQGAHRICLETTLTTPSLATTATGLPPTAAIVVRRSKTNAGGHHQSPRCCREAHGLGGRRRTQRKSSITSLLSGGKHPAAATLAAHKDCAEVVPSGSGATRGGVGRGSGDN